MSFTYDITTDVGKVRFEIGDRTSGKGVRPDETNFSDEEIDAMLTELDSNVRATAARLLAILSREWALVSDLTLGPRKESFSQVSKQYAKLSEDLMKAVGGDILSVTTGFIRDDAYAYYEQVRPYAGQVYVPYRRPGRVEY